MGPPRPFTGAVIWIPGPGGRAAGLRGAEALGLGVVVDGEVPSAAEVMDLGGGAVRTLDLTRRLLVLEWVDGTTVQRLRHLAASLRGDARDPEPALGPTGPPPSSVLSSFVLELLRRTDFDPLVRPMFLRLGFRDICRDLDPHEEQAVRMATPDGGVFRARLDCGNGRLVVLADPGTRPAPNLPGKLAEAFPQARVLPLASHGVPAGEGYRVERALPTSLADTQAWVSGVREGLLRLMGAYEPDRARTHEEILETFGAADTLSSLMLPAGARDLGAGGPRGWERGLGSSTERVH